MNGLWVNRIRGDAERGEAKSAGEYFDELLDEDELLERSSVRLAAHFDALIGGGDVTS